MMLRYNTNIPFLQAIIVVGLFTAGGILVLGHYLPETEFIDIPSVVTSARRQASKAEPCVAGQICQGPTIRAEDPEGDDIVYTFYDSQTKQLVTPPIKAKSGEEVTPTFKFDEAGQKSLYLVVQDGAGHTAPNYPIIVPVTAPTQ